MLSKDFPYNLMHYFWIGVRFSISRIKVWFERDWEYWSYWLSERNFR